VKIEESPSALISNRSPAFSIMCLIDQPAEFRSPRRWPMRSSRACRGARALELPPDPRWEPSRCCRPPAFPRWSPAAVIFLRRGRRRHSEKRLGLPNPDVWALFRSRNAVPAF